MAARIVSIGTAVPETRLAQERVRDFFAAQPGADRLARRRIQIAFDSAAIERRHTVITQLGDPGERAGDAGDPPFVGDGSLLLAPTTGARNDAFRRFAPELTARAATNALSDADLAASDITHVVTVSCTGMFAPGPDYRLVRDLGLAGTVQRYHLGFIGCAAAMPALRLAAQISTADPRAVVLVVCVELCTLHVRSSTDPQQIVASSVFADGAAAAVVMGEAARGARGGLDLDRFGTVLTAEGEDDMVWTIGDHGFEMVLTPEVPRIVGREIRGAVAGFLGGEPPPDTWAVHPGGRSVLDRVQAGLDLAPDALSASRAVLRDYGNMSSATILVILRALLRDDTVADENRIAALAFGPGLTVESALLTKRSAAPA